MNYDKEFRYMLHLLKCAVTDTEPELPPAHVDWNILYLVAIKHRIVSTTYYGIVKLPKKIISELPQFAAYQFLYKQNLVTDANRVYEIDRISNALENNNIDFILLKGSVIKYLYPDTSMRNMSDIDILYRNATSDDLDKIFEKLGFNVEKKDAKDTTYLNSTTKIAVEMQPKLVDAGFKTWYQYYENIWDKCTSKNHQYKMTNEDFYIYHIVHMAKHFKNGGIGLIHILDLFVIRQNMKDLDMEYINSQLDFLGLKKYKNTMEMISDNWFGDGSLCTLSDEQITLLTSYILSGGAFGIKKNQEATLIVNRGGNKFSLLRKIFPNKTTMVNYYGRFLGKHIYLLPLYWIRLNFQRLIHFDNDTKKSMEQINSIDQNYLNKVEKVLDICGLKD